MLYNTYNKLPVETLYELLCSTTHEMLNAYDTKEDHLIAFKARKKQVEIILAVIAKKKNDINGRKKLS